MNYKKAPFVYTGGKSKAAPAVCRRVREWCLAHGGDRDYRIVLCGFEGEHGTDLVDAGWTEIAWFADGFLTGGMGDQQHRERLWASPHCLQPVAIEDLDGYQHGLFDL